MILTPLASPRCRRPLKILPSLAQRPWRGTALSRSFLTPKSRMEPPVAQFGAMGVSPTAPVRLDRAPTPEEVLEFGEPTNGVRIHWRAWRLRTHPALCLSAGYLRASAGACWRPSPVATAAVRVLLHSFAPTPLAVSRWRHESCLLFRRLSLCTPPCACLRSVLCLHAVSALFDGCAVCAVAGSVLPRI